ncbi:hypothetical protein R0K04_28535, partial [Pseudoalteromonas sp. SIMBA_153]
MLADHGDILRVVDHGQSLTSCHQTDESLQNQANAGLNSATAVGGQANAAGLGSTSIGWQSKA